MRLSPYSRPVPGLLDDDAEQENTRRRVRHSITVTNPKAFGTTDTMPLTSHNVVAPAGGPPTLPVMVEVEFSDQLGAAAGQQPEPPAAVGWQRDLKRTVSGDRQIG